MARTSSVDKHEIDTADLKRRSIRATVYTLGSQAARMGLQTVGTVVLARLLTPRDYGLVTMVTVVIGFFALFRTMGLYDATIQSRDISSQEVSNLFWFNVGIGIVLMAMSCVAAPIMAALYAEPEVFYIAIVLGVNCLIGSLSIQHEAILARRLALGTISFVQVTVTIVSIGVAILMAKSGWNYWALVGSASASEIVNVLLMWRLSGWRPNMPGKTVKIRRFIRFGSHITLTDIMNYFGRNTDQVLIGSYAGPAALGLYSRAMTLTLLPTDFLRIPLSRVSVPVMSHLQNDPERFRTFYRNQVTLVASLAIPVIMFMAVLSHDVCLLLLGPSWTESGELLRILAFGTLLHAPNSLRLSVYVALGRTDRLAVWTALSSSVVIAALAIGLLGGAKGVAVAFSIANYVLLLPGQWHVSRNSPIAVTDFFRSVWRPVLAAAALGLAVSLFAELLESESLQFRLLVLSVIGAFTYCVCWLLMPGGMTEIKKVLGLLRDAFLQKRYGHNA